VAVSWVVFWAGRLIQAVSGMSRIFGAPTVPKRCGCRARDCHELQRRGRWRIRTLRQKPPMGGCCSPRAAGRARVPRSTALTSPNSARASCCRGLERRLCRRRVEKLVSWKTVAEHAKSYVVRSPMSSSCEGATTSAPVLPRSPVRQLGGIRSDCN
jgi:hypothetical protein